jgi:glycosidase
MGNHLEKTKLAYLFQFAYPGAPAIYYGDEIGLMGSKDPGCRGAFPWDKNAWNQDLRGYLHNLIDLRKHHEALRRGDYKRVEIEGINNCYAFLRMTSNDRVLVVINANNDEQVVKINTFDTGFINKYVFIDLINPSSHYVVFDNVVEITVPAWGGAWLA